MATIGLLEILSEHIKHPRDMKSLLVHGLAGSGRAAAAGALHIEHGGQTVLITSGVQSAERLFSDLKTLLPLDDVVLFPDRELLPNEEGLENIDILSQRMEALMRIISGKPCLAVVPFAALLRSLMPPDEFAKYDISIALGDKVDLPALISKLALMGYERVGMVEGKRQFSVRGGILDVFPLAQDFPIRIEFFDDEVDSIREFDVTSQRSRNKFNDAFIGPARELIFDNSQAIQAASQIKKALASGLNRLAELGLNEAQEEITERVSHHLELLENDRYFDGVDQYMSFLYSPASLLDYFHKPLVLLDDVQRGVEQLEAHSKEIYEVLFNLIERGRVLPDEQSLFFESDTVLNAIRQAPVIGVLNTLSENGEIIKPDSKVGLLMRLPSLFHGKVDMFIEEVKSHRRRRAKILIVVASLDKARRLAELLKENEVDAAIARDVTDELKPGNVVITLGGLEAGFQVVEANLTVFTELEIYGQRKTRRRIKSTEEGVRISSVTDLRPGDYVVHVNHGIGRYLGMETLTVAGVQKDYMHIKYAGEDKLYVPTDQTELLQRYIGAEGEEPKLNKLGGTEWARVKNRVKESVQEMAKGLLELYAQRETIPGLAYSNDTVWQKEFEDAFPYDETPDQERAIEEIKRDMERPRPMDRLLCGDVGYGKTEVAIRAAFKAVMDNKQVAVLVPTTILAQQHHSTFKERFEGYPINIGVLSRFQTPKQHAQTLKLLEKGELDIVIGTHRLLQKDVKFKDLGLLVVDEEQRFGVGHKEKIKELKKNIDVLTLTATPIPRTLHMSLVGVRDVSIIETPPENRFPVRTFVCEYDEQLLRDGIRREMDRGGQVYIVYNRVQTIDRMVQSVKELVPEAEVAIAHGQMDEHRLERVMVDFYEKRYDVLICTTIIETGMDISNVNTIFIYDADYLGLAQLYQLRGRVGRTNRVAYAYLMYRREKTLSEVAEKRLSAIKEFTDFGSGFKIAMRDLEIRGAGNLLGPEQHGQIASVGFELYCRLLEQAIEELKGDKKEEPVETVIELNVNAFIPQEYISDERQKIGVYKQITLIRNSEDSKDLEDDLVDRFGDIPESVSNLIAIARIKALASRLSITSIMVEGDSVVMKFKPGLPLLPEAVSEVTRKAKGRVTFNIGKIPQCRLKVKDSRARLTMVEKLLQAMNEMGLPQAANKSTEEPVYLG